MLLEIKKTVAENKKTSLPLVLRRMKMADDRSEKCIIEVYSYQGYQNNVILEFSSVYHNIMISLSTLRRRIRACGLRKVGSEVNEQKVKDIKLCLHTR